ncbi:hypothetical protein ES708_28171 [subsurface metagenome]
MKKILISLVTIIVLVMMMLPMAIPTPVLAADTLTLRPDGTSDEDLYDTPGSGDNHTYVSEVSADGDTTYVHTTSSSWKRDRYTLSDTSQTGTINSVTVYIVAKRQSGGTQASARTYLRTGGDTFYGAEETLTTSYATYSTAYAVNPDTTNAWTWSEINDLQAGVRLRRAGSSGWPSYTSYYSRCTQVYVVVDYTYVPPPAHRHHQPGWRSG